MATSVKALRSEGDCRALDNDRQNELKLKFSDRNKNRRTTMNPILGKRQYLIAALLFATAPACLAQGVLAEWNLAATPLSSAVVPSTVNVTSATSITFGGYAGQWSEPASGVLREGPGATTTPALAVASGDYATFTLTDTTPMDLTSLTFGGAYAQFSNPAGYAVESSVDGFASYVTGAFSTQYSTFTTQTIDLTPAQFQGLTSITFRVFGYVKNAGTLDFSNFTVDGSLATVPEPNTLALAGMGLIGMFKLIASRRRN
jgi:hypothetical protein